jgi:hypothetical protein
MHHNSQAPQPSDWSEGMQTCKRNKTCCLIERRKAAVVSLEYSFVIVSYSTNILFGALGCRKLFVGPPAKAAQVLVSVST